MFDFVIIKQVNTQMEIDQKSLKQQVALNWFYFFFFVIHFNENGFLS